jgi:hypothetical protein
MNSSSGFKLPTEAFTVRLPIAKKLAYSAAVAIVMMQGRNLGDIGEVELP